MEKTSCSSETRVLGVFNAEFDSPNSYFLPNRVEITAPFASKLLMDPHDANATLRRSVWSSPRFSHAVK